MEATVDGSAVLLARLNPQSLTDACDRALNDELTMLRLRMQEAAEALVRTRSVQAALETVEGLHVETYRRRIENSALDELEELMQTTAHRLERLAQQNDERAVFAAIPLDVDQDAQELPEPQTDEVDAARPNETPHEAIQLTSQDAVQPPCPLCEDQSGSELLKQQMFLKKSAAKCRRLAARLSASPAERIDVALLETVTLDTIEWITHKERDHRALTGNQLEPELLRLRPSTCCWRPCHVVREFPSLTSE